jgi:tRNA(fMet)-specific endonuclease VapC
VLVTAERSSRSLDALIDDQDDIVIAAITAAELLVGVELSSGKEQRRRHDYVDDVLATIPVEPYDLDIARSHASLLAYTRRSERPRGAHDLVIAATALAQGRAVVSADPSGFENLPGVALIPAL